MIALEEIYTPHGYRDSYPNTLDTLYTVNAKLNRAGIKAPSEEHLVKTDTLYGLIGRPLDVGSMVTIHVGGTNGKGSTSYKVAQCAHLSGLKVGLFVSPHISSFRERVQVNHELIPEKDVLQCLPEILELCVEHKIAATMFEITFVLAALYFKRTNCDVAVIEVGVGGELDATNVIKSSLSIITSVALDHTRILGSTVEEIAAKKAGIFKRGVPALVGPNVPVGVLERVASERGAPFYTVESAAAAYGVEGVGLDLKAALKGAYVDTDRINANITVVALHVLSDKQNAGIFAGKRLLKGLHGCHRRPPCRWQEFSVEVNVPQNPLELATVTPVPSTHETDESTGSAVRVILDVGHNPAAVEGLLLRVKTELLAQGKDVHVLYAVSRDKNIRECLRAITKSIAPEKIHFAQSSNWRAASFDELNKIFLEEIGCEMTDLGAAGGHGVESTVRKVLALSASSPAYERGEAVVLICGTGYIMPDSRRVLGIVEPCDETDLARSTRGAVDD